MQMQDVLEILFETARDGVYVVYSELEQKTFNMTKADLEYAASHGAEIVGDY